MFKKKPQNRNPKSFRGVFGAFFPPREPPPFKPRGLFRSGSSPAVLRRPPRGSEPRGRGNHKRRLLLAAGGSEPSDWLSAAGQWEWSLAIRRRRWAPPSRGGGAGSINGVFWHRFGLFFALVASPGGGVAAPRFSPEERAVWFPRESQSWLIWGSATRGFYSSVWEYSIYFTILSALFVTITIPD